MNQREKLIKILNMYFGIRDSDFYICNRVKEAFALGTMNLDDFLEMDEENTADIADYLLANGVIVPPCKVGDTVYQADKNRIYKSKIRTVIYDTDGVAFDERALGKTVFLTREEAEAALERMNNDEK